MLSYAETETGIPLCDALKTPKHPVWVIHGGDHFTLAFCSAYPADEKEVSFEMYHWNGLQPNRAMRTFKVFAEKVSKRSMLVLELNLTNNKGCSSSSTEKAQDQVVETSRR